MNTMIAISCIVAGLLLETIPIRADQVDMQNGDHYVGKVLSVNPSTVVLKSDVLGTIWLPRTKVAGVSFGTNSATNAAQASYNTNGQPAISAATTNAQTDLSAVLGQLSSSTNAINQVQSQYLADTTPETKAKFNEMVSSLMSGKMDINQLRSQARKAANDLKQMQREVGDDTGLLDSYLSILNGFLQEGGATENTATNKPPQK